MEIIAGGECAIEGTTKSIHASMALRRNIDNVTLFQNRKLKYLRKVADQGTN